MEKSKVYVSMDDDNNLGCSYAIIEKSKKSVIIIFKDLECAIYDYDDFIKDNFDYKYLLFKHYDDTSKIYKDFMKLIGKMCKKSEESKYFMNHKNEDNWMIYTDNSSHHMVLETEKDEFTPRKENFTNFIKDNKYKFLK